MNRAFFMVQIMKFTILNQVGEIMCNHAAGWISWDSNVEGFYCTLCGKSYNSKFGVVKEKK